MIKNLRVYFEYLEIDKTKIAFIAFFLLGISFLEGISIVSILPTIQFLGDGIQNDNITLQLTKFFRYFNLNLNIKNLIILLIIIISFKAFLILTVKKKIGYEIAEIAQRLRNKLTSTWLYSQWSNIIDTTQGEITNLVTVQVNRASALYGSICDISSVSLNLIIYISIAFFISLKITLISIFWALILILFFSPLLKLSKIAGLKQTNSGKELSNKISDIFNLLKPQKVMGQEKTVIDRVDEESQDLKNSIKAVVNYGAILAASQEILLVIGLGTLLYYVNITGILSLPEILVLILIFHRIFTQVVRFQMNMQKIFSNINALDAIILNIKKARKNKEVKNNKGVKIKKFKNININNLYFSFNKNKVLDCINLNIPINKITTIFGPSGSGKSTLINLIAGLYKPNQGNISIDNYEFTDLNISYWRSKIGYVAQDILLVNDSLKNNIIFGEKNIDINLVEETLKLTGINLKKDFSEYGLNTIIGDRGNKISGGQKQRIAFARALYKKPIFLLLDEPTSNLDIATEKKLSNTIKKISSQITTLIISHNKQMIKISDFAYELNNFKLKKIK